MFANEWDKYAGDIYDRHFTHRVDRRDITTIDATAIPDHDILVGGFPCQAFSVAGKRRGFDDTRGTLFFDIARILESKRPAYFVLENVKGLLSHDRGRTFRVIIETLDELGYDLQWQVCNSSAFGVPQNRERVFIVGHTRGFARPEVFPLPGEVRSSVEARWHDEPGAESYIATRHLGRNGSLTSPISATVQVSETPHVMARYSHEPMVLDAAYPGRPPRLYTDVAPTVRDYGSGGNKMPMVRVYDDYNQHFRRDELIGTLTTNSGSGADRNGQKLVSKVGIRRLTPVECERLQGLPDNWTAKGVNGPISDTQRYKVCGNAVTVNVVEAILARLPR